MLDDEDFLRKFHHALLEVTAVVSGTEYEYVMLYSAVSGRFVSIMC